MSKLFNNFKMILLIIKSKFIDSGPLKSYGTTTTNGPPPLPARRSIAFETLPDLTQIKTAQNPFNRQNYVMHNNANFSQNPKQNEYYSLPQTTNQQHLDGYTMQYSVKNDNYQQ